MGLYLFLLSRMIFNIQFYKSFGFDSVDVCLTRWQVLYMIYDPYHYHIGVYAACCWALSLLISLPATWQYNQLSIQYCRARVCFLLVVTVTHLSSYEYMCDAYSMDLGFDMERALVKVHVNNVYNIVVDKHYSRYYNSHPSLMERLEKIEEFKSNRDLYAKLVSYGSECTQQQHQVPDLQNGDDEILDEEEVEFETIVPRRINSEEELFEEDQQSVNSEEETQKDKDV